MPKQTTPKHTPTQTMPLTRALFRACFNGDLTGARRLLAKGASVDLPDNNGYTALHRIAYSGNMECAHLVCAWIHEKVEDKKDPEVGRLAVAQLLGYRERREENGGHVHTGKILGARDNRSKRTALERAQLNSHHELIDYWQHKFLHGA